MGGIGSGRNCTNELTIGVFRLDVLTLERAGFLEANRSGKVRLHRAGPATAHLWTKCQGNRLVLDLDLGCDLFGRERYRMLVGLLRTSCNYGGDRPWWICPGRGCGRLATILYGKREFLCRRCRRVSYPMQRVSPRSRALAQAQAIRIQLGGGPDVTLPFPPRPKGMHDWTYTKIALKGFAAEREASKQITDLLGPARSGAASKQDNSEKKSDDLFPLQPPQGWSDT